MRSTRASTWLCALGVGMSAIAWGCSSDDAKGTGLTESCTQCGESDAGGFADAAKDTSVDTMIADVASEEDSAPYTGPTADISGTVFAMIAPTYEMQASKGSQIFRPVTVRVAAFGKEYSGKFEPGSSFSLQKVPQGEFPVLVSDIDAGNAALDTSVTLKVGEGANHWELPIATRPAFVVVYGTLAKPLVIDAYRAQAIVTFESCESKGSNRLSGVTVTTPEGGEGVVYHASTGWTTESASGTDSTGTAILANVPAEPFPGKTISLSYTLEGKTYDTIELRLIRGAVTRLRVVHPCQ